VVRYAPSDLMEASTQAASSSLPRTTPATSSALAADAAGEIPLHSRNNELTSRAGAMRRRGMSEAAILAALLVVNREQCHPPLNADEVASIARSVGRYPVADSVSSAGKVVSASTPPRVLSWRPFPLRTLPLPLRRLVKEGAASIGCDPAAVAVLLFAALGGAIGTTRRILLKRGWAENPIVWALLVGPSGKMRKSPVVDLVAAPLRERQQRDLKAHKQRLEVNENEILEYEMRLAQWKQRNKKALQEHDEPPEKPEKPISPRCVVSDVTVEALAPILGDTPRGVTLIRDELSGWIKGFNQYKAGGQGADVPHWLEAHRGGPWIKDRRKDRETLFVPRAAVSVFGAIQPGLLGRCFDQELFACGLVARIIFVAPPGRQRVWTEAEVAPETASAYAGIIDRLLALPFAAAGEDDDAHRPIGLMLTAEAKERFVRFVNEHGQRTDDADDDVAAAFAKLEGYAARFALILHLVDAVRDVAGVLVDGPVGLRHIEAGIEVAQWVADETERIYATFDESEEDRARRELFDRIQALGGAASARDLQRRMRRFPTAEAARAALQGLVDRGLGKWITRLPGPEGGQPAEVVELVGINSPPGADADTTSESPDKTEVPSASTAQRSAADKLPELPDAQVAEPMEGAYRTDTDGPSGTGITPGIQRALALGPPPFASRASVEGSAEDKPGGNGAVRMNQAQEEDALRLVITGELPPEVVDEAFAMVERRQGRQKAEAIAAAAVAERERGHAS